MRANPLICVEVDEVASPQQWTSVLAYGRYCELPDTPEYRSKRQFAGSLLQRQPIWWEPDYVKTILGAPGAATCPFIFLHSGGRTTGHRGQPSERA